VRFDSLFVGPDDDPAVIRLHPRLTVISGIAAAERLEMFELLLGALTGTSTDVREVRYLDNAGRAVHLVRGPGGPRFVTDEGEQMPSPLTLLGVDQGSLRRLMLIEPADVGVVRSAPSDAERPELAEAESTLALIDAELRKALAQRATVDALWAEVAALDERLNMAEDGGARRRFARLLGDLERVRIEAGAARGGSVVADADRRFVSAAGEVNRLAGQWRNVDREVAERRARFGDRERLDPRTLAEALAAPDQVPPQLDSLAAIYEAAEARRALLNERLGVLAAGQLAQPSHPAVIRLAHGDQERVWTAAHKAIEASEQLQGQSVALGGLETEGVAPTAVLDLEAAHDAVDQAERVMDQRLFPGLAGMAVGVLLCLFGVLTVLLLSAVGVLVILAAGLWALMMPRRSLAAARGEEQVVLERAGVPSYLGFQFRRLEVTMNPEASEPLAVAALEYRRAMAAWRDLAGELLPSEALALEAETRAYAASMTGVHGAADQIDQIRDQLVDDAEPAVTKARQRLLDACAPFGITDPNLAVDLVRHQVRTSSHARLQQDLETAEDAAAEVRSRLDQRLADVGFSGGDVNERLESFDRALSEVRRRQQARQTSRPVEVVEAELAKLEAMVHAEHRPEWGTTVTPADADEPDVEQLRKRRQLAIAEHTDASRTLPDIERLSDRRDALARRVSVLEGHLTERPLASIDAADLEQLLLARVAAARRVGPTGEAVPLILNEPFESLHGDPKWVMLEAVERLSGTVQVTYLTDDVDTIVWARRRAAAGAISLLEPIAEPTNA
jgi:hypothetical protein